MQDGRQCSAMSRHRHPLSFILHPLSSNMLQALVRFSLKYRGVVVVLACVVMGYGLYIANNAKLDVFPNFVQPQVAIQTECPGMSPEQVELLVTLPIETMVNGLGG